MIGIYKITSPTNRIYIGQSIDIKKRFRVYKNIACREQTLLARSFKKYGFENHKLEVIHECEREELNDLEIYYIQFYNSFNSKKGLNLKAGGQSGGVNCEAVKQKLRKPKPEASKEKYRQAALNRGPVTQETRAKHRKNMLGNKNLLGKKAFLGKTHSEETKNTIREAREKQVMPKGYKRPEFSQEWKDNMSNARKGDKNPNSKVSKANRINSVTL